MFRAIKDDGLRLAVIIEFLRILRILQVYMRLMREYCLKSAEKSEIFMETHKMRQPENEL